MDEEKTQQKLRRKDILKDWKHYPSEDDEGNPIIEDFTELREEWLHEDCDCNEYSLATREKCIRYYSFDYYEDKFKLWMQQQGYTENTIAYWGLEKMFDDGWIKSPAFVDWSDFKVFYNIKALKTFIESISDPEMRVDILSHLIKNADYIYGGGKKQVLPTLKLLRDSHKAAIEVHKKELAKQKAEQRKLAKKEKIEFVLSLEEIIEYVTTKSPESASVIRSMLYDMMLHKEGWNTPATLKKIDAMGTKIVHNGDTIYGDKHVGTQIDSVASKAIGVQEIHE